MSGVTRARNALPSGFAGPRGNRLRLDLAHAVGCAVDVEVEPEAEEVLVIGRCEPVVDDRAAGGLLAGRERHRGDDAVQLHLALDRAVEAEVPAERVVVVADRHHRVHDEAPRPAHLDPPRELVAVLPEQARVLLVQADGVRERARATGAVDEVGVEVADLPTQSQPSASEFVHAPRPYSPASK